MTNHSAGKGEMLLGIDGGATRTVALLCSPDGRLIRRLEAGPANVRLLRDAQFVRLFRQLARDLPRPAAIGLGLAGAREEKDRERVARLVDCVWPGVRCRVTHDLDTAMAAAEIQGNGPAPRVIVLSGTGSCCYGRSLAGKTAKIGGWGHILGDKGSGYEIGLRALKAIVYYFDRDGAWSRLGRQILTALQLNDPEDLIPWVQNATKDEIAALAAEVFSASGKRDRIASDILQGAASSLARDAVSCAAQIVKAGREVEFVFAGGVLLSQPGFQRKVRAQIAKKWSGARCVPLRVESAWGAVALAGTALKNPPGDFKITPAKSRLTAPQRAGTRRSISGQSLPKRISDADGHSRFAEDALSPTEERNPKSLHLDKLSLRAAIRLMLSEEARVPSALLAHQTQIEKALKYIVQALRRGGKLFYVGAGTSGRLGVLDASECPPTFRTPPDLVQGIMAGGQRALWQAVEGAEDDPAAGAEAIRFRAVTARDVVVGIAASGRTPFVWGALEEAKRRRAQTILICFNPRLRLTPSQRPKVVIAPEVGPEILTGSTRLKCGTATKLILNIFTTLSMVKLGKVLSNLMVDVHPSNAKLRDRAVRIVRELSGADAPTARQALEISGWNIKEAWHRMKRPRRR